MNKEDTDPVAVHFRTWLKAKQLADGNRMPDIAKGDCTIMLHLIRMKLDNFQGKIDPSNPGRFRGIAVLRDDMRRVLGRESRFHYTKWGASHLRGALRDDEKRGNKRHLIHLVRLLNEYKGTPQQLQWVYDRCIQQHDRFWESFSLTAHVQQGDPFQTRLCTLLSLRSRGRVQQGLVYSSLRRRYGDNKKITTKRTFAGDEQSSQSGAIQRGDIQVWEGDDVALVLEIKGSVVDEAAWGRVQATHGRHDYALFVLATGFHPAVLQREINSLASTYALHLEDFLLTLVFTIAADENAPPTDVLSEIVGIYNEEFCAKIEGDPSIRISIAVEQPPLVE